MLTKEGVSLAAKEIRYAIAIMLVLAILFVVSSDTLLTKGKYTAKGEHSVAVAAVEQTPSPHRMLLNRNVLSVVVADLSMSGALLGSIPKPTIVHLLVIDEQDNLTVLSIPACTRVEVKQWDEQGTTMIIKDDTLAGAYPKGVAMEQGYQNLLLSVSSLMGGVPMQKCILIKDSAIADMINDMGGIYVPQDFHSIAAGGTSSTQQVPALYNTLLTGDQSLAYMASSLESQISDVGAIERKQNVLFGVVDRLQASKTTMEHLVAQADGGLWHNLAAEDLQRVAKAFASYTKSNDASLLILWGQDRIIDHVAYRLPDPWKIQEFVLDRYYQ